MIGKRAAAFILAGTLGLTACADSLGPEGNASQEDREEILTLLDESGYFADDFGIDGAYDGSQSAAPALAPAAELAEVEAPRIWGRRRGFPVRRLVTVDVDPQAGTALVSKEVFFEGRFLLDITEDGQPNPTEKPLEEKLVQYATFRRLPVEAADAQGRRWRLVAVSPAEWVMTVDSLRTVDITKVVVSVNGVLQLEITDPSEMLDVEGRIPKLNPEDEVTVRAWVENSLDNGNEPDTFVFLHLFHATPVSRAWIRLPMERVITDVDTYYELTWHARHTGRARIAVDAIDAETFTTETEDDYRANIWGVPYRIVPVEEAP
ncbi:MAG: hypothetical protein JSW71_05930 [Gemmatimonadota bacterium]|nr:MAG: hypothetical protein JSW71_05930 [Gemmatimonadota bacterium]